MTERPLRVLELGGGVSAAYAAKLLGDHGADVVKVESPEGDETRRHGPFPADEVDSERSGLFLAVNLNKRGICLDLDTSDDLAELKRLINWADILVHNFSRLRSEELGLDPKTIKSERPDLVVLSITPFGIKGPYRDFSAEELTLSNAGGWANTCPRTHTDPTLPPLKVFGQQCGLMSGIAGALAALATYRDARRSGVGDYIDLSVQEYVASVLEGAIPHYTYFGDVRKRYELTPWRNFEAKNGSIFLLCVEPSQWDRLVEFMGYPAWTELEVFGDPRSRLENYDVLDDFYQDFIGTWDVFELFHAGQNRRLCFAPVLNFDQFASNEHLRARNFFTSIDHPLHDGVEYLASAVVTTNGRAPIRLPAPRLGEHTSEVLADAEDSVRVDDAGFSLSKARRPLEGIRVLDLTWVWAGPFGTMNLAHLGAEVIRMESSVRPDLYRRGGNSNNPEAELSLNRSGMFNQNNQGKKSLAVDFSTPQGVEIVKQFVAKSDVVVENFATGVMARLGLGYPDLKRVNPRIVVASISGYGQTGPYREYMSYGPAIPPLSGISSVTGFLDGGPELFGPAMPDPTAGITAALAVVSALERRDQTGVGDHLDISLWESTGVLGLEAWMQHVFDGTQPRRIGNRDPGMSPHGCFPCRGEDAWVSIACAEDEHWLTLAAIIDLGLANDARFLTLEARKTNEDALEKIIATWTARQDPWAITWQLQEVGLAAFPSLTPKEIIEDPHINERGFIERLDHPEVGRRAHVGVPWRFETRPNGVRKAAPCLGADTETLLSEILGFDTMKIAELREIGVLR